MSNSNNIFTRTRAGMDIRIWFLMAAITIVATGLLSFKMATHITCTPFSIAPKGYTAGKDNSFYVNQTVTFSTNYTGKEEIIWDFGDHGTAKGASVSHAFRHEGQYAVSATVNGKCVETYKIFIVELQQQQSNSVSIENPISGPELVYAGDPASFNSALAADRYEWAVLNSPEFPVQTEVTANFIFPVAGTKIIELKLDGDMNKVYRKNVQVLPKIKTEPTENQLPTNELPPLPPPNVNNEPKEEEPTKPATPKVLIVPNEEFKAILEDITSGKKDLQSINQYLCNTDKTKALINGTDWETVGSFVQKIYGKKKFDIKSVEAVRDENNCVTILKIKYKKRLF